MESSDKPTGAEFAEKTPRRVFLDVGASHGPSIPKDLTDNDLYIGIDAGYELRPIGGEKGYRPAHELLQRHTALNRTKMPDKHISFMGADGTSLPLRNASVHEINISNLLGASISGDTISGILREAGRVLEDKGEIQITEDISPIPVTYLKPLLLRFGFKVDEIRRRSDNALITGETDKTNIEAEFFPNQPAFTALAKRATKEEQENILKELEENPAYWIGHPQFDLAQEYSRPGLTELIKTTPGIKCFKDAKELHEWIMRRRTEQEKPNIVDQITSKAVELGTAAKKALRHGRQRYQERNGNRNPLNPENPTTNAE